MGEFVTALNLIEDIKRSQHKADDVEILLVEAFIQESMKIYDQMFYKLQEALKLNPNNTEALEQIWISVEISKNLRKVSDYIRIDNNNPYSYLAGIILTCIFLFGNVSTSAWGAGLFLFDQSTLRTNHHGLCELALQENLFEKKHWSILLKPVKDLVKIQISP